MAKHKKLLKILAGIAMVLIGLWFVAAAWREYVISPALEEKRADTVAVIRGSLDSVPLSSKDHPKNCYEAETSPFNDGVEWCEFSSDLYATRIASSVLTEKLNKLTMRLQGAGWQLYVKPMMYSFSKKVRGAPCTVDVHLQNRNEPGFSDVVVNVDCSYRNHF